VGGTGEERCTAAISAAPFASTRNIFGHRNWLVPRILSELEKYTWVPSLVVLSPENWACAAANNTNGSTARRVHTGFLLTL
jgi:hypothetical protein